MVAIDFSSMQGLFFVFFGLLVLVELKLENQKIRQHYLFFKWIRGGVSTWFQIACYKHMILLWLLKYHLRLCYLCFLVARLILLLDFLLLCSELKKGSKVALVAAKIGCYFSSSEFQNWSIPLLLSGTLFSSSRDSSFKCGYSIDVKAQDEIAVYRAEVFS